MAAQPTGLPAFGPRHDGKVDRPSPPPSHFFKVLFAGLVLVVALPYIVHFLMEYFDMNHEHISHLLELKESLGGMAVPSIRCACALKPLIIINYFAGLQLSKSFDDISASLRCVSQEKVVQQSPLRLLWRDGPVGWCAAGP